MLILLLKILVGTDWADFISSPFAAMAGIGATFDSRAIGICNVPEIRLRAEFRFRIAGMLGVSVVCSHDVAGSE
jgi:hypothetical protein